jgi:ClpP class serine protease
VRTKRPSEAVFADGRTRVKPLALHPKAIGVSYDTYEESECGAQIVNGVAILPIEGPLEHKPGWWQDYESLGAVFGSLCNDGDVRVIVLKFDSPGGE